MADLGAFDIPRFWLRANVKVALRLLVSFLTRTCRKGEALKV